MTQPSYQTKVRPSAWWYSLVAVAWIASAVVFLVIAIKPFIDIATTDVTQFNNGDPVSIGSDGLSVYVENDSGLGECTLTGDGGAPIRLDLVNSVGSEFQVDTTGPTLTAYASTPDGLDAGTYTISCVGGEATILATGERIDEDALETSLGLGFIISLILGVLGLALLITLLVKRHNSKNQLRAEQSAAYYGAWAQQQGHDPYGQQGYGSPQGYGAPYQQDPYGQHQPPADPYGQPAQPPYDPYGQPPPPPAYPYGQPPAPPSYDPYGQPPPPPPPAEPYPPPPAQPDTYGQPNTPEPEAAPPTEAAPGDTGDSEQSSDSENTDDGPGDGDRR